MSIASEKVKLATERFLLVRMNPARYILPVINGGLYEITLPFTINKIERNGVALTKDSSAPSVNDHWYQNESTGLVQVKLASPPDATANILVCNRYLFYTGTIFRAISEDPEDALTTVRDWQPRLSTYPTLSQSFDNIINGIFTISDTSIDIINEDGQFQEYLTDDDSFYNKDVEIWLCISSVANIQKIFSGTIRSINLGQNNVSISVVDRFNSLKQPAYMGDTSDECYFRKNASSFPDMDPKHIEKPVPYIVGSSSRHQTEVDGADISGTFPYRISLGTEAVCTNLAEASTTTNRVWGACRYKGNLLTQSYGTSEATTVVSGYVLIRFSSIANVTVGDTFKWNNAGNKYAPVCHVGTFTHSAVNYNLIIKTSDTYLITDTVTGLDSFSLFIERSGIKDQPLLERDFTLSETATSGLNNYLSITFVNNFEAAFTGTVFADPMYLDPSSDIVYFRTSNDANEDHGEILSDFCAKSNLAVNATTFSDAYTDLPSQVRFHIPNFDETSYKTYLEYAQDVLKSTLGYLKININFEVEYYILTAPTSTAVRDNLLMLDQSTSCALDYQDIVTQIIAFNPHHSSQQAIDQANSPSETRENAKAIRLHGITNVDRFRHVLEEITSRIDDHMALKSMRKATYSFSTATEDIDSELGDDLQLENKIVLGTTDIQDVKIITIEKSPSKISLVGQDLKGL